MDKPKEDNLNLALLESVMNMQNQLKNVQKLLSLPSNFTQELAEKDFQQNEIITDLNNQIIDAKNLQIQNVLENKVFINKRKISTETKEVRQMLEFFKIVFTGGPCAGKTTAITKVADQLREKGYTVFLVPEAATMIFGGGGDLDLSTYTSNDKVRFQYYLLMLQVYLEDLFAGIASINSSNKVVLLCDRGVLDGSAYLSKKLWNTLLNEYSLKIEDLRDHRYDLIIHLSTAADGAEEHYGFGNNNARHEDIAFAKELDSKLQDAWIKHPNFVQVNNQFNSFNDKINEVSQTVLKFLGLPTSTTFYKKFIIANPNQEIAGILEKEYSIVLHSFKIKDIIFFKNDQYNALTYYRRRIQNNRKSYIICEKKKEKGEVFEKRRQISYKEYKNVKNLNIDNKHIASKTRHSFMWQKINYIMDTFFIDGVYFSILVIQGFKDTETINMPDIIKKNIVKNVSDQIVDLLSELLIKKGGSVIEDVRERLNEFKR